jgi:hypothetical protein
VTVAPRVPASLAGAALLAVLAAGCAGPANPAPSPPPATAHVSGASTPDVTGVVAVRDGDPVLTQASDDYYEGMGLSASDPSVVSDAGALTLDDLADGDAVEVWLPADGACAESLPVQCAVLTVRVVG